MDEAEEHRWDSCLLFAVLAFFVIQASVNRSSSDRASSSSNQAQYLHPPPKFIERFTFGFNLVMADSLWLRWIQESDTCQTYAGLSFASKSEVDTKKDMDSDALTFNPRHKVCDNSWGFFMLDAITRLDPKFQMAYEGGATILSVLVEDYEGATVLYERGLKAYPDDWHLAYMAAYHFLFDLHDIPRAASLLERAGDLGGPPWLKSLASRLYTRLGQLELGISTLETYRKTLSDPDQITKVDERLRKLREQLARSRQN